MGETYEHSIVVHEWKNEVATILWSCVSSFLLDIDKEATNRCFVTREDSEPTLVSRHVSARNSVVDTVKKVQVYLIRYIINHLTF